MEEVTVGTLGVDATLNVTEFERESGRQLKESSERIGREAGKSMGAGMDAELHSASAQAARRMAAALEAEFQKTQSRIKRAVEGGLLTPAEAEKAGREAAREYNKALTKGLQTLDRGTDRASMALVGVRLKEAGGAIEDLAPKSKLAVAGLGELRSSFASVLAQVSGVPPVLTRITSMLGNFAVGSAVMIAVFAGLSAMAVWWNKARDAANEAREKFEDALESAKRMRLERETAGDIDLIDLKDPIAAKRDQVAREIRQMEQALADPSVARMRARTRLGQDDVSERVFEELVKQETEAMRTELDSRTKLFEEYSTEIDGIDLALAERIADRRKRKAEEEERERKRRIAADEEMYGEARRLLEEWRQSQISPLEKQIELLGKMEAAARLLGEANEVDKIVRQTAALQAQLDAYNNLVDVVIKLELARGQAGPDPTGRGARPIMPSAAASVAQIQGILSGNVARLRTQRATGDITSEEMEAGITAAAQRANQALLTLLETWKALGVVPRDVLEVISKALEKNEVETDANTASVGDYAAAFESVARGVLGAADAMGVMSDQSRRLFTGLLDVASALQQIDRASKMDSATDGFAKMIGMIGGVGALVGGALQIGASLFGESPEERERKDILKRNTKALEDLALELSGFRVTGDVVQRFLDAATTTGSGAPSGHQGFVEQARRQLGGPNLWPTVPGLEGFTLAELRAIEQWMHSNGIDIDLFDSSGRLVPGAVDIARDAIRQKQAAGGITAGAGIAPQDRLSVSMTVVQGNQIVNVLTSINDHVRALRAGLVGNEGITLPASAVEAGVGGTTITLNGGIHVSVASNAADPYSVGRDIGRGVRDQLGAAWRAAGRVGRMTVVYRDG